MGIEQWNTGQQQQPGQPPVTGDITRDILGVGNLTPEQVLFGIKPGQYRRPIDGTRPMAGQGGQHEVIGK